MKSIDKYVLVLVASLALLLAGCGGGSTVQKGAPPPTQVETAKAAFDKAEDGVTAATTDAEMLAAYKALQAAADALVAAQKAAGEDSTATAVRSGEAKAMVDSLTKKIADAATAAGKMQVAMAQKLFNGLAQNTEVTDGMTDAEKANRALRASRFISLSDTAITVDDDQDDAANVTLKKTDTAVPALAGWMGSDYMRKSSGTTDHIVLYSNRGMESEKFSKKHQGKLTQKSGTLDFEIVEGTLNSNNEFVMGGDFATSGTKGHTENSGDKASLSGTFDGVSGTYSCTQSGNTLCTSQFGSDGDITFAGGWVFDPSNLDAMTKTEDANYLIYGWWSRETAAGVDVATSYEATAGAAAVASGNDAALGISGSATYKGGAAGKYAVHNPLGDNSSSGAFTANAKLTANFTDNKVSGELTDFMSGGKSMDWTVSLNVGTAANIVSGGITGTGNTTTWTMGETASDGDGGTWEGDFYKTNGATSGEEGTQAPSAVIGEFTAAYTVGTLNIGQMVGAFGADKE